MRTCPRCRRHAFATEPACPFCGGPLPLADGPRGIGVALGLALASCGGGSTSSGDGGSTGDAPAPDPISVSSTTYGLDDGTSIGDTSDDGALDDGCEGSCCGGFYGGCPPDAGPSPRECDLLSQNCPAGEKCMPWALDGGNAWNATRCTPVAADPVPLGGSCTAEASGLSGIDDCDVGLMCWKLDEQGVGHCEDLCTGSIDDRLCDSPADVCYVNNDEVIAVCVPACDPIVQDCAPGEACWPAVDLWACLPEASGGTRMPGTPCISSFDCDVGLVCIGDEFVAGCSGMQGCCAAVCDLTAADADAPCLTTDPTASCEPWYIRGFAPVGLEHVGVCMTDDDPDPTTGG